MPIALAWTASTAVGQGPLVPGDVAVMTRSTGATPTAQLHVVDAAGTHTLSGLSTALADAASSFALDAISGDWIVGASSTQTSGGPAEIWRVRIAAGAVVGESLLLTLPGTDGLAVTDMHRESNGCILALTSAPLAFHVFRIAVSPSSAAAYEVPLTASRGLANTQMLSICSSPAGSVHLGARGWPPSTPEVTGVMSAPPAGGHLSPVAGTTGFGILPLGIEFSAQGFLTIVGSSPTSLFNYLCGQGLFFPAFIGASPGSSPEIADLDATVDGSQFWIAINGSVNPPSGFPGNVWKIGGTNCGFGTPTPTAGFADPVVKVQAARASSSFGCPCATSLGLLPWIFEMTPPAIGQSWIVEAHNAPAFSAALLMVGGSYSSIGGAPLPFSFAPMGADGLLLLTSSEVTYIVVADGSGVAVSNAAIPTDPVLVGATLYSQWLFADSGANPVGYSASAGIRSVIGP
ncbi:MAG: hypothetical protein JNJ88_03510 [Planctomycetes bacterium]|nr:hypothetical protein [Planctomycetota bacterium]